MKKHYRIRTALVVNIGMCC